MAENVDQNANENEESSVAILNVPSHLAQQVIDYMNSLESDESDVSGHAFTRAGVGSMGTMGTMAAKGWTGTSCTQSTTGLFTSDMTCSDTDEIVIK